MTRKEITIEQYKKLKDCKVLNTRTHNWMNNFKLVRRNKCYTLVAFLCNDNETVLQNLYRNSQVITL